MGRGEAYLDHHLSSPVSFLILAALFCNRRGVYVSFIVAHKTHAQPDNIVTTQVDHLQPKYSDTKPPIKGPGYFVIIELLIQILGDLPVTGPFKGAMLQTEMAKAR